MTNKNNPWTSDEEACIPCLSSERSNIVWFELGLQRRVATMLESYLEKANTSYDQKLFQILICFKNQYILELHCKNKGRDTKIKKTYFFYFFFPISTLSPLFSWRKKRTKERYKRIKIIRKERGLFLERNTSPKIRKRWRKKF